MYNTLCRTDMKNTITNHSYLHHATSTQNIKFYLVLIISHAMYEVLCMTYLIFINSHHRNTLHTVFHHIIPDFSVQKLSCTFHHVIITWYDSVAHTAENVNGTMHSPEAYGCAFVFWCTASCEPRILSTCKLSVYF